MPPMQDYIIQLVYCIVFSRPDSSSSGRVIRVWVRVPAWSAVISDGAKIFFSLEGRGGGGNT